MLYPENHEQCWRSVEERRPVERSYLLEIVALHTIPTCQGSCLTSQSAPQRKMGLSLYHASGHTTRHLRGVTFVLNVGTRIFSSPYSDVMAMNMSTDMECRLIAKHNVPQKSFIIVHLMKHICSKRESIGSIRRFDSVQQLQFVTRKT